MTQTTSTPGGVKWTPEETRTMAEGIRARRPLREIAEGMGRTFTSADRHRERVRGKARAAGYQDWTAYVLEVVCAVEPELSSSDHLDLELSIDPTEPPRDEFQEHGDWASGVFYTEGTPEQRSLEAFLKHFDVDTDTWMVEKWIPNLWQGPAAGGEKQNLYQIKVILKRRVKSDEEQRLERVRDCIYRMIENHATDKYKGIRHYTRHPEYDRNLLVKPKYDVHISKLGLDYGPEGVLKLDQWASEELYRKSSGYRFSEIWLPISEVLHTEDGRSTTAGTPQDVGMGYFDEVDVAFDLLVKEADRALEIAPTKILVTPGNHSYRSEMHLAKMLQIHYKNEKHMEVRRGGRIYQPFGINLFGFAHGNEEKHALLPMLMADEAKELWGQSEYREWILGHFHHKKVRDFKPVDEVGGVILRILSSLSAKDEWHERKGYRSMKAAEAMVYNYVTGYETHFAANILRPMLPELLKAA